MIELRWLTKSDGSRVLQMREYIWADIENWTDWQDVPEVTEEGEND